jgi:hypothetical protein
MSKKILQIVRTAYRATIEEQDDTVVWLTHVLKDQGADIDLLLKGEAINYAVSSQDPSGLSIGDWKQTRPPDLCQDLSKLLGKGCNIYFMAEDAAHLGLERKDLLSGMKAVSQAELPQMFKHYENVWSW